MGGQKEGKEPSIIYSFCPAMPLKTHFFRSVPSTAFNVRLACEGLQSVAREIPSTHRLQPVVVQSLGVLLYELLTGTTPFDDETLKKAGFDEMRRIIREDEPPRPSARLSTLNMEALSTACEKRGTDTRKRVRSYRGDVDWIAMRALEKNRDRRYESASALGADVSRYLTDEPIEAKRPTFSDRILKWSRRHKTVVVVSKAFTLTTTIGLAVATVLLGDRSKIGILTSGLCCSYFPSR